MSTIIVALVGGAIIGFLGKMVAPGNRDDIPLWLTLVCGIGGMFIGTFLYSIPFGADTPGFDWWRHLWQVVVAAVLVAAAATLTGRDARQVRRR